MLEDVPTPVWIGAAGLGVYVLFRGGVFAFLGTVFEAGSQVVGSAGEAGSKIIDEGGELIGGGVIDGLDEGIVRPVFKATGMGINGVTNFFDNIFTGKTAFGQKSKVGIFPFSIFG